MMKPVALDCYTYDVIARRKMPRQSMFALDSSAWPRNTGAWIAAHSLAMTSQGTRGGRQSIGSVDSTSSPELLHYVRNDTAYLLITLYFSKFPMPVIARRESPRQSMFALDSSA